MRMQRMRSKLPGNNSCGTSQPFGMACDNYINDTTTIDQLQILWAVYLKDAANTEHTISTVYSDLAINIPW